MKVNYTNYGNGEYQISFIQATTATVTTIGSGAGRSFRTFHWINKDNSLIYSVQNLSTNPKLGLVYYRATFPKVGGKTVFKSQQITLQAAQKLTGAGVEKVLYQYERDSALSSADSSYPISRKYGKVFGISETIQEQAPGDTPPIWNGNNYVYLYDNGVFTKRRVHMGDIAIKPTWSKSERYLVYRNFAGWNLLDPATGKQQLFPNNLSGEFGKISKNAIAFFAD